MRPRGAEALGKPPLAGRARPRREQVRERRPRRAGGVTRSVDVCPPGDLLGNLLGQLAMAGWGGQNSGTLSVFTKGKASSVSCPAFAL